MSNTIPAVSYQPTSALIFTSSNPKKRFWLERNTETIPKWSSYSTKTAYYSTKGMEVTKTIHLSNYSPVNNKTTTSNDYRSKEGGGRVGGIVFGSLICAFLLFGLVLWYFKDSTRVAKQKRNFAYVVGVFKKIFNCFVDTPSPPIVQQVELEEIGEGGSTILVPPPAYKEFDNEER